MSNLKAHNSFGARTILSTFAGSFDYFSLVHLAEELHVDLSRIPYSIRILLESVLRAENGASVTADDVAALVKYDAAALQEIDVPFLPARVLMQDFTGVPCIVDLAAMRNAMARLGGDSQLINPLIPVDLVIDHSVQVDAYNSPAALRINADFEFERNRERYEFLHWGQKAFANFRVAPPASGICHQVNLEYLGKVVQVREYDSKPVAFPDSLVGTDSHTTMINGLGIIGWGVGGIEAEAAMLGQPLNMMAPAVVGFELTGLMPEAATATDLVLMVTQTLRKHGVVDKFVEFFGNGLSSLTVQDRATIANMAPEYGATMGFFPVDEQTLVYLRNTGRPAVLIDLVERYCKAQGLFRLDGNPTPAYEAVLKLDLATVEPSVSGPKRPQDRVSLSGLKSSWHKALRAPIEARGFNLNEEKATADVVLTNAEQSTITHGAVALAAITSCTNTSNPSVLIGAGLLAKKACEKGLKTKPWVKTSLAPGSKVVTDYLDAVGLTPYLEQLGYHTVGYGCTTCIGNSGPLPDFVAQAVTANGLVVAAVLSGNRNFEGRINPLVQASYLASPMLVVAFGLAGTVNIDLEHDPIGLDKNGRNVYLKDLWPRRQEIEALLPEAGKAEHFHHAYDGIDRSNPEWNAIPSDSSFLYSWDENSTYIQQPPFFSDMKPGIAPIEPITDAHVLVKLGNSVTTDHISPAGNIAKDSEAGAFLLSRGIGAADFNSYGSRRGNDRVMTRGTFANIRLRNELASGKTGGWTKHIPSGEIVSIYQASLRYKDAGLPVIVLAGAEYGMGSSRDWAAKGTLLLGVKAVIAESFERIHRSNLIGMGVLPLQFKPGESHKSLGLSGEERYSIDVGDDVRPGHELRVVARTAAGSAKEFTVICRLNSEFEVATYRNGGILPMVLRGFLGS